MIGPDDARERDVAAAFAVDRADGLAVPADDVKPAVDDRVRRRAEERTAPVETGRIEDLQALCHDPLRLERVDPIRPGVPAGAVLDVDIMRLHQAEPHRRTVVGAAVEADPGTRGETRIAVAFGYAVVERRLSLHPVARTEVEPVRLLRGVVEGIRFLAVIPADTVPEYQVRYRGGVFDVKPGLKRTLGQTAGEHRIGKVVVLRYGKAGRPLPVGGEPFVPSRVDGLAVDVADIPDESPGPLAVVHEPHPPAVDGLTVDELDILGYAVLHPDEERPPAKGVIDACGDVVNFHVAAIEEEYRSGPAGLKVSKDDILPPVRSKPAGYPVEVGPGIALPLDSGIIGHHQVSIKGERPFCERDDHPSRPGRIDGLLDLHLVGNAVADVIRERLCRLRAIAGSDQYGVLLRDTGGMYAACLDKGEENRHAHRGNEDHEEPRTRHLPNHANPFHPPKDDSAIQPRAIITLRSRGTAASSTRSNRRAGGGCTCRPVHDPLLSLRRWTNAGIFPASPIGEVWSATRCGWAGGRSRKAAGSGPLSPAIYASLQTCSAGVQPGPPWRHREPGPEGGRRQPSAAGRTWIYALRRVWAADRGERALQRSRPPSPSGTPPWTGCSTG